MIFQLLFPSKIFLFVFYSRWKGRKKNHNNGILSSGPFIHSRCCRLSMKCYFYKQQKKVLLNKKILKEIPFVLTFVCALQHYRGRRSNMATTPRRRKKNQFNKRKIVINKKWRKTWRRSHCLPQKLHFRWKIVWCWLREVEKLSFLQSSRKLEERISDTSIFF